MIVGNYVAAACVFGLGLYTVLSRRNLIKIVMGLSLMESSTYLLLISMAYRRGSTAPVLSTPPSGQTAASLARGQRRRPGDPELLPDGDRDRRRGDGGLPERGRTRRPALPDARRRRDARAAGVTGGDARHAALAAPAAGRDPDRRGGERSARRPDRPSPAAGDLHGRARGQHRRARSVRRPRLRRDGGRRVRRAGPAGRRPGPRHRVRGRPARADLRACVHDDWRGAPALDAVRARRASVRGSSAATRASSSC